MENRKYPLFEHTLDLLTQLPNERALKDYLAYMRWGDHPQCINCKRIDGIRIYSQPGIYECPHCDQGQFSVLQGTIMERTSIPLHMWLWAMFEFCIDMNPSTNIAKRHNIQQKTAHAICMRFRLAQWEELNRKLQGKVYADEMEIGSDPNVDIRVHDKREAQKKRGLPYDNTRPIFGMIEAGKAETAKPTKGIPAIAGGQLLLFDVPDKGGDILQDLTLKNTLPEKTQLYTDGWRSYQGLNLFFDKHYVIKKTDFGLYDFRRHYRRVNEYSLELASEEEVAAGNFIIVTTNPIENVWSQIQIEYFRFHGYSQQYAQLYLNEYMFRFNHRHLSIPELFEVLLMRCCNTPLYERRGDKRVKVALEAQFTWRNKRGGGHKWKPA